MIYDDGEWDGLDPDDPDPGQAVGVRFGAGQDPRRGGRPKGSANRKTIIKRVANKRHNVRLEGKQRRTTTLKLILLMIRTRAAKGDIAAFDLREQLEDRFAPRLAATRAVMICSEKLTSDEWLAAYGHPDCDEEEHQRMIEERFSYILPHRLGTLAYRARTDGFETLYDQEMRIGDVA